MPRRPAQEIADALRSEILAGRLRPGDQVPSEHQLTRQFSTTRTSAQKAIATLRAEGHLIAEHGRGSSVRKRPTIRLLSTGSHYRQRRAAGPRRSTPGRLTPIRRSERLIAVAVGRRGAVVDVHPAGLNSFQCPSETTSTLPPVTLMAV
jgi:DNA-binding transcriptional MocR family regulator